MRQLYTENAITQSDYYFRSCKKSRFAGVLCDNPTYYKIKWQCNFVLACDLSMLFAKCIRC